MAVSSGGVWVINERKGRTDLGIHESNIERNIQGLTNIARCLRHDGFLLLSVQKEQKEQKDYEQHLPDGIVYSQSVKQIAEDEEVESIEKSYFSKETESY